MMAILAILFIVILDLNQVRKQRIADKYLSHSREVTGNVQEIFQSEHVWKSLFITLFNSRC